MAKKKKMDKSNNEIILLDQDVQRDPAKHYPFDQEAQKIFNTLPARHKTHLKASEAITQAADRISSGTETGRSALRNGLTYDQFLADLLYPEETMLVSQFISFNSVVFDEEPQSPPRSEMTSGRAFLTSRRLLLLSAEVHQGLKLEGVCYKQNKKPFGYTVAGMASDNLHFLSIPLTNIHSVELNVSVGVGSAETVRGVKPRPCCLALCSCFGIDRCIKQWISTNQTPVLATNERILIMGVTMPPWNNRYMTNIHLNAEVPLTLVKEYIVVLTRSAPNVVSQNTASA